MRQEDAGNYTDPVQQDLLQKVELLFWNGKFPEALEQLSQLKSQEALSEQTQLQCQLLKCRILAHVDIKKAKDLTTQIIKISQDLDQPLIQVDALLIMAEILQNLGKLKDSQTFVEQGKAVLASISNIPTFDRTAREVTVLALESGIYTFAGPTKCEIESIQQSLRLHEQQGRLQEIAQSYKYLVQMKFYLHNGELEQAEGYLQQNLTSRDQMQPLSDIAQSCIWLGWSYFQQGDIDRALKYYQQSLAIFEHLKG